MKPCSVLIYSHVLESIPSKVVAVAMQNSKKATTKKQLQTGVVWSCFGIDWRSTVNWQRVINIKLNICNVIVLRRKPNHYNSKAYVNKWSPNHEVYQHSKTTNISEVCFSKSVKAIAIYFITKQCFSPKPVVYFLHISIVKNTATKTARCWDWLTSPEWSFLFLLYLSFLLFLRPTKYKDIYPASSNHHTVNRLTSKSKYKKAADTE